MHTISQVARMLGLPSVTIRAWEQRYGVVSPERKPSGHRLYSEADIEDLRWLMEQIQGEDGLSISQAAQLLRKKRSEQSIHAAAGEAVALLSRDYATSPSELQGKLLSCLSRYQSEEGRRLMDLGFTLFGYDTMIGEVVIPLLHQVGDEWEAGGLSVAQEHFITHMVMQRCTGFAQLFPMDPELPGVVAFCPAGEHHHVGLMLFSLFLRQRGVDVIYLGPNTPSHGLSELIRTKEIAYAAVSLTDSDRCSDALATIDSLQAECPWLGFVLGGSGFADAPEPYRSWHLDPQGMNGWNSWFDRCLRSLRRPSLAAAAAAEAAVGAQTGIGRGTER